MDSKFSDTTWSLLVKNSSFAGLGARVAPRVSDSMTVEDLVEIRDSVERLMGPKTRTYVHQKSSGTEAGTVYVLVESDRVLANRREVQDSLLRRFQFILEGRRARMMVIDPSVVLTEELKRFRVVARRLEASK
jgi:hypothetical protein